MHRLKVSLLCLLSLSIAGSVFGQTADPQPDSTGVATLDNYSGGATYGAGTYFNIRYMSGNGVGYQQGYSQIGGFLPFWMSDNSFIAPDVRLLLTNYSGVGGNIGGVYRNYNPNYDRIFGAASWFDMDQSSNRNTYTQGTFGLETLGQYWDLRANAYYVPGTQDKFVSNGGALCVSGNPFFSGNNIAFQGQQAVTREVAMSGFDAEFGMPLLQSMPWLRAYGGLYHYHASQVAAVPVDTAIPNQTHNDPWGFRGRLDAWIADDLLVGVNVTTDNVWGTNVNAVVDFRFSGFKPTRYFPQWTTRERMLAPWQRNWRIAVEQYGTDANTTIAAINPSTGKPYFVSFIDNTNVNAGTGTFEDPYNSFNHPGGIPGADIIVVERGSSTLATPYLGQMTLLDNQRLFGEGATMAPLPLTASFGACTVNGNFTLPGLDGSGNYPFVSNPGPGPTIKLANNNEVAGFNIVNGGGSGIVADVNNFNLHNLEIRNMAGVGMNLTNSTGTGIIKDINIGSTNLPNPNGIGNNAGGGIYLDTGAGGMTSLTMTNVFMNSKAPYAPGAQQPFGISLNANAGNLPVTMTNVHANGNSTGIILTESGRTLTASMSNVTANNNTNNGLVVTGTGGNVSVTASGSQFNGNIAGSGAVYTQNGGTGTFNASVTQFNGNGQDGLGLFGSAGAVTNVNIFNSQLSSNSRDGLHNVQNGSTATVFVDPTNINQNGRDGYNFALTNGASLTQTFLNDTLNSNVRSAIFGTMDNSTATFTVTNTLATNSGQNGFLLNADHGSVFNATILSSNFNSSGMNGFTTALHNLSSASFNMTSTSVNSSGQNGMAFLADNSSYTLTGVGTTFNGSLGANGIVGTAQNLATANLSLSGGSSVSGNAQNGVYVSTTAKANVVASFTDTAINNNLTGNGIRLNMSDSPASSLSLFGTTSLNSNGANGLLIDASNATNFTPTLSGTSIQGNTLDGVKIDVLSNSTVGSLGSEGTFTNVVIRDNKVNGVEANVSGFGSNSDLIFTNAQITNSAGINPQQIGFLYNVQSGGALTASLGGGTTLANHKLNAINGLVVGAGSTAEISLSGVNASGSGATNAVLLVTNGGFMDLTATNSHFDNSVAGAGMSATSIGANSSLNVCLDSSTVSSNKLQGISIVADAGGTASFGVGNVTPGTESTVDSNVQEGVLALATNTGVINFRSMGSHFDLNGLTTAKDGLNFGGDDGVIRTLFYGGSADGNGRNGLRVGPIEPNASSNNSDLTVSLANGFSASNNANYGLVIDGTGANSANLLMDPSTPPPVFVGNGAGAQNLNFAGANQVVLQELGSFNGSAGDGVVLNFANINTAIVSFNGLGTGTINGNAGNGINVTMTNVKNGSVLVTGYTDISNNGLDGIHIAMTGASAANPMNAAIEIDGVSGNTNMASNGHNAVDIAMVNARMVSNFASLPGVNLTVLTPTDNQSFNSCIPLPLSLAGGLSGLTPAASVIIHNLNVTGTGATGGTGGITVTGTDTTIDSGASISNNIVSGSLNGPGISVSLNETVAPTVPVASGFTIAGNNVVGNAADGIDFHVTNAAVTNVATADNLHITGNTVSVNNGNGISVILNDPATSVSTANAMQISGNTVTGNNGNGVILDLTTLAVAGLDLSNPTVTGNAGDGVKMDLTGVTMTNLVLNNSLIDSNSRHGLEMLLDNSSITGFSSTGMSLTNNDLVGMRVQLTNASSITNGSINGANISTNGLDGVSIVATDGTNSTFGSAGSSIMFNTSTILDNGQAAVGSDGMRLRLYGGSSSNIQFNSTTIGNTSPGTTQTNGLDFILGSAGFPGGKLVANFTNSFVTDNNGTGVLGIINGTGVVNGSTSTVTFSNTSVSDNVGSGLAIGTNNAGKLGLIVANNSLFDSNGADGIAVGTMGTNSTFAGFISDSSVTNNGVGGAGNGVTASFNANATGNMTITNSTIGNTAPGGTQQHGLSVSLNQATIGANTDVQVNITGSNINNNSFNGIEGDVIGSAAGPNPFKGLRMVLDSTNVTGNSLNGAAFNVTNGGLLAFTAQNLTSISSNGQDGLFLNGVGPNTLVTAKFEDSVANNNGSLIFPGDGINATATGGAVINIGAQTTGVGPVAFSGNTGDGIDAFASDVNSGIDLDLHNVIAGADLIGSTGFTGNTLNGVKFQSFDGAYVHLRAYDTHFDGNGGAGLLGTVTDSNGSNTEGIVRIISGSADGNGGDGYSLSAFNTSVGPLGTATITGQFQDDPNVPLPGISAQNNGGIGLNFVASGSGGIVGNLLMSGGSTLLNNGIKNVNVNMAGADQAIVGLSGTFDGSSGDGVSVSLSNISGLGLVSIQGPGEVKNNAGNGISVSLTDVLQGGVFIGGFTDVSNNGTANGAGGLGQDGIKVVMNDVGNGVGGEGALTIDGVTPTLPSNVMNVSNNTGNGVNVLINNGSQIDNTSFSSFLVSNTVNIIQWGPTPTSNGPESPLPANFPSQPNPLLTIVPANVTNALGIQFTPNVAIQNLTMDDNGKATGGNTTGNAISVNVDGSTTFVNGPISINNNVISNTGVTSSTKTHNGIGVYLTNNAQVSNVLFDTNSVTNSTNDGIQIINPSSTGTLTLDFTGNTITGNGTVGAVVANEGIGSGIDVLLNSLTNMSENVIVNVDGSTAINTISNNKSFGLHLDARQESIFALNVTSTGGQQIFDGNSDAGIGIEAGGTTSSVFSTGTVNVSNVLVENTTQNFHLIGNFPFQGDGLGIQTTGYAEITSFVVGDPTVRNTVFQNNGTKNAAYGGGGPAAGDGINIHAIDNSKFVPPVTGTATVMLQNVNVLNNLGDGINIFRTDNALLSIDVPGHDVDNVIGDTESFIHANNIIATGNTRAGLNLLTTGGVLPVTRIDIVDTTPADAVVDSNFSSNGIGMKFLSQADAVLVVNARDTQANNNNGTVASAGTGGGDGIYVETDQRATFGDMLQPISGSYTVFNPIAVASTFNGITASTNSSNGFEIRSTDATKVKLSMTNSANTARNTFDNNGGDDIRMTNSGAYFQGGDSSANLFMDHIDMFHSNQAITTGDGLHVSTSNGADVAITLLDAVIGAPRPANSTTPGLNGNGIELNTTDTSSLTANLGDTTTGGDPLNAPDVSIYGNQLNGVLVTNSSLSNFNDTVYNVASRFNALRGYSALMSGQNAVIGNQYVHKIDHSLFEHNTREGIGFITNTGVHNQVQTLHPNGSVSDQPINSWGDANDFLRLSTDLHAALTLTNSTISNNGTFPNPFSAATPVVNGLLIDVSTNSHVNADIRSNFFSGNKADDMRTQAHIQTSGGFDANGNPTGAQINTNASINAGTNANDVIFQNETAQMDMRFMFNKGDHIFLTASALESDAGGGKPGTSGNSGPTETAIFQVNAFHFDTVAAGATTTTFSAQTVLALDAPTGTIVDPVTGNIVQTGVVNDLLTETNPTVPGQTPTPITPFHGNGFYTNSDPNAFTPVRVDFRGGVNNGSTVTVTNYNPATGTFTVTPALGAASAAGNVFRVHLLDTNTFDEPANPKQNIEAAFSAGFSNRNTFNNVNSSGTASGPNATTTILDPYYVFPDSPFFP